MGCCTPRKSPSFLGFIGTLPEVSQLELGNSSPTPSVAAGIDNSYKKHRDTYLKKYPWRRPLNQTHRFKCVKFMFLSSSSKRTHITSCRSGEITNAIIPFIHAGPSSCSKLEVTSYARQSVLIAHLSRGVKDYCFIIFLSSTNHV